MEEHALWAENGEGLRGKEEWREEAEERREMIYTMYEYMTQDEGGEDIRKRNSAMGHAFEDAVRSTNSSIRMLSAAFSR